MQVLTGNQNWQTNAQMRTVNREEFVLKIYMNMILGRVNHRLDEFVMIFIK